MQDKEFKKHIGFIDNIKILSIFFVIVFHTCIGGKDLFHNPLSTNWKVSFFFYNISSVCVPLFFMVSGALTIYIDFEKRNLLSNYKKIIKLIIPLFFWSIFYEYYFVHNLSYKRIIQILYYPTGLINTWFIYVLVLFYLLSPIFIFLLKRDSLIYIYILLILWIIFCIFANHAQPLNNFLFIKDCNYRIFSIYELSLLGYYLLGCVLMKNNLKLSKNISIFIILSGYLLNYYTSYHYLQKHATIAYSNLLERLNFLSLGVIMASIGIFSLFQKSQTNSFIFPPNTSKIVFGIYFVHELVLQIIRKYNLFNDKYAIFYILNVAIITMIISSLISLVLAKIQGNKNLFF